MSPDEAFLQVIREAPEDDGPRLIYADWLEDRNDPRGEFIRVQCNLARLPADDERRPDLEARELQLLAEHRKEWARPLRPWVKACEFRCGLVEGVKLRAETFLERAEELFRLAPVRHLHLVGVADHADALADSPHLARVRSLALADPRFTLGQRPRWENRQRVRAENPLGTTTLRTLLGSRHLTGLKALDVQGHCLGAAGAHMLAGCPRLAQIEALDLRNNDFEEGDVAAIVGSPHLGALRQLRLGSCFSFDHYGRYPADGIGVLPREVAPITGRLELLDLGSCGVMLPGLRLLAQAQRSVALSTLLLERNPLIGWSGEEAGAEAIPDLLGTPLFEHLHTLDLSSCYLGADVMGHLAGNPRLAGLVRLGLRNNAVRAQGVIALAASPYLNRLQRLELAGSSGFWGKYDFIRVSDEGVRALAAATGLLRLSALDLRRNGLTAVGARALAGSALDHRLYWLDLRHNRLGDEGAAALLRGDWPRLAWLDLRANGIGPPLRQALRERFGHAVRY